MHLDGGPESRASHERVRVVQERDGGVLFEFLLTIGDPDVRADRRLTSTRGPKLNATVDQLVEHVAFASVPVIARLWVLRRLVLPRRNGRADSAFSFWDQCAKRSREE